MSSTETKLSEIEVNVLVIKTVRETLISLGIDLEDRNDLRALKADFAYMRRQRLGAESTVEFMKKSIITAFIGGLLFALWQGVRALAASKGVS